MPVCQSDCNSCLARTVNGVNAPRGSNTKAASRSPRLVPCVSEVACDKRQIGSWSSWGSQEIPSVFQSLERSTLDQSSAGKSERASGALLTHFVRENHLG
ncbi:hypothetical protein T4D_10799 [Trichinella pseudospiralis]|uniref:Uncharacterized protein n=1 Tax=Trichinella pseudospiralis TaxID=6337 RepID=A0A0V1F739_TRIPS|nr:hypothetical protein T4D_10799 [Trichinella pseudospiralis]